MQNLFDEDNDLFASDFEDASMEDSEETLVSPTPETETKEEPQPTPAFKGKFKTETITKKEFYIEMAERLDVPVRVINEFFDTFIFILKEKLIAEVKVQLSTLGTFETKVKKGRTTVNPFTENKDQIVVPEKRIVKFTPSKYLREIVNF